MNIDMDSQIAKFNKMIQKHPLFNERRAIKTSPTIFLNSDILFDFHFIEPEIEWCKGFG